MREMEIDFSTCRAIPRDMSDRIKDKLMVYTNGISRLKAILNVAV